MSCVSVTFTQNTYENNSFCEITQCRQSLCHVCLQCIKGKYRAKMRYYMNSILKKDIRKKPLKAPISNHIYGTLICDLQLLSTKLNLFDSWVGHLNTIFIPQWNSCSVRKKTWEMPKKCAGKEAIGMFKIDCTIIVKPYSEKNCALGGNSMVIVLGLGGNFVLRGVEWLKFPNKLLLLKRKL